MSTIARNHELDWLIDRTVSACAEAGIDIERHSLRSSFGGTMPYHSCLCWASTPDGRAVDPTPAPNGCGFDNDLHQARIGGLAEALERYCLTDIRHTSPLLAAENSRGVPYLREEDWPTYAPWQLQDPGFPHRPYSRDAVKSWALAEGLNGPPLLVPASLIWQGRMEDRFMPIVSSGTACHSDMENLLLTALFEVVERDGFMIAWSSRTRPPGIAADAAWLHEDTREIDRFCNRTGLSLMLRDLTTDLGIPTVLAMIRDMAGRRPALCIGAACRASLREAALKAAKEAYQCWAWMADEHLRLKDSFEQTYARLRAKLEMPLHPLLFGYPEAVAFAAPLLDDPPFWRDTDMAIGSNGNDMEPAKTLHNCLAILEDRGFSAYRVQLSPPTLQAGGLSVMRVIVPGLVPLAIGDRAFCLGHPRIWDVPARCGWATDNKGTGNGRHERYPPPHPFP
ncbi:YcaO-like family protein [Eilatimonas milleporae]|uniref:Thiazole/oxazole-forming peptide maturase SagD family component n=1 Tax=Eilatimonas milleporae TaxID=911205 RepID=A0A3M0CX19_9PROT|nr:YcaO-like family protein [Eilatimonas milleporae]RMB11966.1 thiazole/oxazole-forming peptide maturase SagD family component [Eilatimonas milleporae]